MPSILDGPSTFFGREVEPLARSATPEGVLDRVGRVLALSLEGAEDSDEGVARIGDALASRGHGLLVLDDVDAAVAFVARAVADCRARAPDLSVLVTSRQRLRVALGQILELEGLGAEAPYAAVDERAAEALDAAARRAAQGRHLAWCAILDGGGCLGLVQPGHHGKPAGADRARSGCWWPSWAAGSSGNRRPWRGAGPSSTCDGCSLRAPRVGRPRGAACQCVRPPADSSAPSRAKTG